eukprot:GCRY01003828.1.p1 GENE.GCRY01003828.1~~GCRY01003828.1.p1  ORF type:complete len:202 (+),score=43.80 GCRY01003828.1:119-724(+)
MAEIKQKGHHQAHCEDPNHSIFPFSVLDSAIKQYEETKESWDIPLITPPLKEGFTIRPLLKTDYYKGFNDLLSQLTTVDPLSHSAFEAQFSEMHKRKDTYFLIAIEEQATCNLVGLGTLFVERKFIHSAAQYGHIEDIVVDKGLRGLSLGKVIIHTLLKLGVYLGCYKVILDCSDENIPFYEKCGLVHCGNEMALYVPQLQ